MNSLPCKYCNKIFKSYQSRSNHYKRFHTVCNPPENTKLTPNEQFIRQNSDKNPPNNKSVNTTNTTFNQNIKNCNYICEYCNYEFTRNDSLKKHYTRCKIKNSTLTMLKEKNELLEKKIIQQNEQMDQIKTLLTDILNKNCKVHLALKSHEALDKV